MKTAKTVVRPRLAGAAAAIGLLLSSTALAAPASAHTPCTTGPNYCHIDSDYVEAARTGVRLTGRLYWDSRHRFHFNVRLTDTLRSNSKDAILIVSVRVNGTWRRLDQWNVRDASRDIALSWSESNPIEYVRFRVGQTGDLLIEMAEDLNRPMGD